MREFLLVEFTATFNDSDILRNRLLALGGEFVFIDKVLTSAHGPSIASGLNWVKITGKISSEYASVIKLQDPFLSERMRISYIDDSLKDKYRK